MTLARFREEPWRTSHGAYQDSALAMSPAPEYASSEVILSSLYRHAGLEGATERTVPQRGRDLDKEVQWYRDRARKPDTAAVDADTFHTLLHSVLESPKLPNQSSKRFVQVTPLVPQAAVFSGSARLSSNSWPAGALIRRMVWLGSPDKASAAAIWQSLFGALSITDDDDIFARFLQAEIEAWCPQPTWAAVDSAEQALLDPTDRESLDYPARRFVRDLGSIIDAKDSMTRRQWTSLLEAIVRLAAVAHVTWLCDVHAKSWECIKAALDGNGPADADAARALMYPKAFQFLSYGDRALPGIKDRASAFLQARLGLNTTLWGLEAAGIQVASLSSARGLADVCNLLRANAAKVEATGLRDVLADVSERETRTLLCKKGIGSNIMEFARHVLGQRQAANPVLRGYDQGFSLRKRGTSNSSPWVVGLGPVSVLALVHCSLAGTTGPRSVRRLSQHLAGYGAIVDYREIATNDLGHQLRMLGLVLDSPDAESGMLLVPPFPQRQEEPA
ncbi:hypothetical protein [Aureimonas sp. Leaf324]|uniref:hypothetical protein n=1 Tax=Aureimonas sp. Leaf324 TaxID=1736336 RepID=UPI0006F92B8B|nr:hypothetical protein [Aureimonas sp. Leaf324]KQQ78997.1 hypothetical protein ASF65_14065 [Aureimonas sp. Leaf324]